MDELNQIDENDVALAPTNIMCTTWLNELMHRGFASFNDVNGNIIDLNTFASSWFAIGRDNENLKSCLFVPRNFLPWFIQLNFKSAYVSFENSRLYLSCGTDEKEGLTISFKIRKDRLKLLWHDSFSKDDTKELQFRAIALKADNSIIISERILHKCSLKNEDDLSNIVIPPLDNVETGEKYVDEIRRNFEAEYAQKYLNFDNDDDLEW